MQKITIKDKTFSINIPSDKIQNRIGELAKQINSDYKDKIPVFICVLSGSFLFAADLIKKLSIDCEVSFIRVSSYSGTQSTGVVKSVVGISTELKDRHVVILEDIVDTGDTAVYLFEEIKKHAPADVRFASLLLKPKALRHDVKVDYLGFEVPNDFLVGYGLDYDGLGRNYADIYKLSE
ncbi:MAG: hypoxanthine phosphoribosyltransferase [Bacteroidetes bacterium]|nr:hypoxanthine phosphoribosyltransferase [Bacteroidota bacterium]MBL0257228.1 hypoxanthine phosphoribosyltransferase [Bacteroidota bacterium]MBP6400883.1 hypoxanthine phosphoribosyltransferase [Bacteroidia bacterium]MBP6650483.1 hypoxanthine phosphoribosyltransferase [Bacteroidia bacterium]